MNYEIINRLKKKKGITNAQLAQSSGVTLSTIDKITAGINTNPKLDTLQAICRVLGCKLDDFNDSTVKNETAPSLSDEALNIAKKYNGLDMHGQSVVDLVITEEVARMSREKREKIQAVETEDLIHFLAPVSAGDGTLLDESDHKTVKVVSNTYTRRADFMVSVRGKSMEPRFFDGDLVLIQETDDIEIGEVGIWYLDGRSYIKQKGHGRLISLNEKYFDVFMEEFSTCRCQGRVIGTLDPDWIVG